MLMLHHPTMSVTVFLLQYCGALAGNTLTATKALLEGDMRACPLTPGMAGTGATCVQ